MLFSFLVLTAVATVATGCSNIVISPGASSDSSAIISYNADSGTLYGSLYHYPASFHNPDEMRDIYDWDSGRYLGQIKESPHTFNVVGNINEHGVIIGETTFGGLGSLQSQKDAKMDYGSLIWVTLQRAKSAREAIKTLGSLMKDYGYASEGESFSIADNNEAWIMEIIGKGAYELGSVWVALKVPDGYISAHANQARITTFPLNDPTTCLYSADVITFARGLGLYSGTDKDFSFSDTYDPVSFSGARFCEARVWSVFGAVMGEEWAAQYLDYAQGYNLTNRMPLFVKPVSKISVAKAMELMRSHYENTLLDMSGSVFSDVGASFSATPVRTHPLTWSASSGKTYLNERPIATQQTGWNFVAQSRRWMPAELSGIIWFGVDDSATTVHVPVYGSATKVPEAFAGKGAQDGVTPPLMQFDMQSAFYAFNLVANWAYSRWDLMYPEIKATILAREAAYFAAVTKVDSEALLTYSEKGAAAAVQLVTDFSRQLGNQLVQDWGTYFGQLFVKYRDGYVITANVESQSCGCSVGNAPYPLKWYDRIVEDTKDHYLYDPAPASVRVAADAIHTPVAKLDLLAKR